MKQIAIIGNARSNDRVNSMAESIGRLVAEHGANLICGGLGGVMAAACRGYRAADTEGVTVGILPGHDPEAANPWVDVVIPTGMDVARNALLVASANLVIALGGGAGTLSELALATQMGRPAILLHGAGGWTDSLADRDHLDERQFARLYHANDVSEAGELISRLFNHTLSVRKVNQGVADR